MNTATLILLVLASGIAVVYGVTSLKRSPSHLRALFKSTPLFLLSLAALQTGASPWLVAAFALCFLGDWCLAFDGDTHFIAGLGSFLLAHLAYSVLFLSQVSVSEIKPGLALIVVASILFAAIVMINIRLWPHTGHLRFPVLMYSLVIALMAISANVSDMAWMVQIGIAMFVVSDIILSEEKFLPNDTTWMGRNSASLVWWLYIGGQLMIAKGLLIPNQFV